MIFLYIDEREHTPDDIENADFVIRNEYEMKKKGEDFRQVENLNYVWASPQEVKELGYDTHKLILKLSWNEYPEGTGI